MEYISEIEINLPVNKVVELFDNSDNLKKWQPGLLSFQLISGEPGKPGTKSKLLYKMNGREVEMIETITVNNLPDEFSATYETKGVYNLSQNYFIAKDENTTLYKTQNEFICSGFVKLIAILFPRSFRKETMKYMTFFKEFVEKDGK